LAIAQHKFGNVIEITGNDEFKKQVIEAAVNHDINIRFSEPAMENERIRIIGVNREAAQRAAQPQQPAPATEPPAVQQSAVDALAADAAREAARLQAEFQREIREAAERAAADREEFERVRNAPELGSIEHEHEQRLDEIDDHDIQQLRAEQQRAAQPAPAPEAQQPNALDEENPIQSPAPEPQPEPQIDYLAEIHQQIATAIAAAAAADQYSRLGRATTEIANPAAEEWGTLIIASNAEFVAVRSSTTVKIYRIDELNKNLSYDGTDATDGKFAVGNELTRKNGRDGMRTLLTEEREHALSQEERDSRAGGGIAD
jgi:hypothetical protein